MTTTTKPSSRYRWKDREGNETQELQQLRTLRAMGQTPSQLAAAFGLTVASIKGVCHTYAVRSPRSVLPGQAGSYRQASALDQAQPAVVDPADPPVPAKPITWADWEAFYEWQGQQEERREHFRQLALAKREEATADD
jgi:hypothetical protein